MHDALLQVSCKIWAVLEMKLNKVMFFCLFSMFLSLSTGGYGTEVTAAEKRIVPYQLCLEIDRDGAVGPLVHYD